MARLIQQGKDAESATVDRITIDIKRERKEHERAVSEALGKVRDLEKQIAQMGGARVE